MSLAVVLSTLVDMFIQTILCVHKLHTFSDQEVRCVFDDR